MENNTLQHHGVKGMRWGFRRYQNADGSLTAAGKKRQAKNLKKARDAAAKKREEKKAIEEKRAKLLTSTDAKELYKNRDLLSNAEINDRLNRIDLEARLASRATSDSRNTNSDYMRSGADTINKITNTFRSIDNAYSAISNSAITKMVAKKLGLEPPKKMFNLDDAIGKMASMTNQEVQDVKQRVINEKIILQEQTRRKEEKLADAQRQVDDYNAYEAFKRENTRAASPYRKSGAEVLDSILDTGRKANSSSNSELLAIGGPVMETLLLPGPSNLLEDKSR